MPLPSDWATFVTTCQMTSKDHYIGRCQSLNATTQVEGKMLHLTKFQKFVAVLQDAFAESRTDF